MLIFGSITTLILGLAIGSFLNVLIYRLPKGESIWRQARSYCPHCNSWLGVLELIPVISFLWLQGMCLHCKKKISWQYPVVELLTAVLFVLVFWRDGGSISTYDSLLLMVRDFIFVASLIVIFMIDWKHMLILDKVVYPLMPIIFVINWALAGWQWGAAGDLLLAGLIGFMFYFVQYQLSQGRWVGGGDMKLAALLGLMFGVRDLLVLLFIAYVGGAIISLLLVAFKKKGLKSAVPMAVFLVPAAWVTLFFGNQIVVWYLSMFL